MSKVINIAAGREIRERRAREREEQALDSEWFHVYRHVAALLYSYYVTEGETGKAKRLGETFANDLSVQVTIPGSLAADLEKICGPGNYLRSCGR